MNFCNGPMVLLSVNQRPIKASVESGNSDVKLDITKQAPSRFRKHKMSHNIIIADDHLVFRTGMARVISMEDDLKVTGQFENVPRLLKSVSESSRSIVLYAASLGTDIDSLLRATRGNGTKVIVVLDNEESPQDYLRKGARGAMHRNVSHTELLQCLRSVGRSETYVQQRSSPGTERFEVDTVSERVRARLTPKELKIVGLILRGYKNREIAEELKNSEQVIRNYLRSIFDKTGVSDRLELALFTMHHKLLASAAMSANTAAPTQAPFLN